MDIPSFIPLIFSITTLLTALIFFRAAHFSGRVIIVALLWILLQAGISYTGFYTDTTGLPPRFALLVIPPLLLTILLFVTKGGRRFIDQLDTSYLTLLHVVRIPVELVLYWLFLHKTVPELMTFAGRNFDILAGISAPFIYYFGFIKKTLSPRIILIWNIVCLCLLLNIVANAILSVPFRFQQFAFEQPDIALTYFPFTILPCFLVPVVLFAHLATIRKVSKGISQHREIKKAVLSNSLS